MNLGHEMWLILLETDQVSYEEYCHKVPASAIPKEYQDYASFLKNKGKASKRIGKQAEWNNHKRLLEAQENWNRMKGG